MLNSDLANKASKASFVQGNSDQQLSLCRPRKKPKKLSIDDIMQLVKGGLLPNCKNINVSLPIGVILEEKKIIQEPIQRFFFKDAFNKMCFCLSLNE